MASLVGLEVALMKGVIRGADTSKIEVISLKPIFWTNHTTLTLSLNSVVIEVEVFYI